MVRRGGKKEENAPLPENPEVEERKRLKKLAFSKRMLSEAPVKAAAAGNALHPSKTVIKHHGKDLIRKSQRSKSRFLFSFPGLLGPVSGGKIGELKDLGSKNPILYLDFPQVRRAHAFPNYHACRNANKVIKITQLANICISFIEFSNLILRFFIFTLINVLFIYICLLALLCLYVKNMNSTETSY